MAAISGQPTTKVGTISGNIVESGAPAFAQWIALRCALTGAKEPPPLGDVVRDDCEEEARQVRVRFEQGAPLCIAPVTSVERFLSFVPTLRWVGDGRYQVGQPLNGREDTVRRFAASGHGEAMARAAKWYDAVREREVAAQKKQARETTRKAPPIYLDLAALQLSHDDLLLDEEGQVLVLLNFAHGLYLVSSRDRCYTDGMAPSTAVRFALMGAQRDKVRSLLRPTEAPLFAGLSSWQGDGEGGYTWDAGGEDGRVVAAGPDTWRIWMAGSARAAVRIGKGIELKVAGSRKALKSPVPQSFQPGGQEPLLAWAAWKTVQLARRRV